MKESVIKLWVSLALAGLLISACDNKRVAQDPEPSAIPSTLRPTDRPASVDLCARYPPPFEAGYLPEGFRYKLRTGAGLFRGTDDYPTEGLLGHYYRPADGSHVNFQIEEGPLPYEPSITRSLSVFGHEGSIAKIEGGWSVSFSYRSCEFEMDNYGITRAETIEIATRLRPARR